MIAPDELVHASQSKKRRHTTESTDKENAHILDTGVPHKHDIPEDNNDSDNTGVETLLFVEFFAGSGNLSAAVAAMGIETAEPQDILHGGIDFTDENEVMSAWADLQAWRDAGYYLVVHLAPPCSTFSRALDRNKHRLRSTAFPMGLPQLSERPDKAAEVEAHNQIAALCAKTADFVTEALGCDVTWEQPSGNYMFLFLHACNLLDYEHQDHVLHQCRFGRPYKKATTFRCFGQFQPRQLALKCTFNEVSGLYSCGRAEHEHLEFGGASTRAAATYPESLCFAYAAALQAFAKTFSAISRVILTTEGKVKRHVDRGEEKAFGKGKKTSRGCGV